MNDNFDIQNGYKQTMDMIRCYMHKYLRSPNSIRLIAVSKRHSANKILNLSKLGHRDFAENYVQEWVKKMTFLKAFCEDRIMKKISWHFIGHIQSRKSKIVAENFDWVHTVDSLKIAQKLNQHRQGLPNLNILIQINLNREKNKHGIEEFQLYMLAESILSLSHLNLRGLMIVPKEEFDFNKQKKIFFRCKQIFDQMNNDGFSLDQLSMGMSNDMEAAISEGTTQLRIGTSIFGEREKEKL